MNIKFRNKDFIVTYSRYVGNQRISIALMDDPFIDPSPYLVATVNLPNEELEYNEVAIKNWSENEGILEALVNADVISSPHREVPVGYTKAYICYINDGLELLKHLSTKAEYSQ